MSKQLFDKVAESIAKDHPSFKIRYKDESRLMRFLAVLVYPFNARFAGGYITTLGSTVYFPSREGVEKNYAHSADVLAHEGVHVFDAQRHGLWFAFSYALNQIALLPLMVAFAILGSWIPVAALVGGIALSYVALWLTMKLTISKSARSGIFFVFAMFSGVSYLVLSIWLVHWWAILGVAVFTPLLPVSSLLRARWEYRGYAMGIAMQYWRFGSVPDSHIESRIRTFAGPDYYFMDRNADRVRDKLMDIRASVLDGTILLGALARPYQRTLDVLKELGLVKGSASA